MIISASRRTDIPAFYSEWLMNRIRAGTVKVKNPFNPTQVREVSLRPGDVDCFVFWTKNPAPMLPELRTLDEMTQLAGQLAHIAARHSLSIYACCETVDLSQYGVGKSACIDKTLIEHVTRRPVFAKDDPNQRPGCGCCRSVDIGAYNTCGNGCVYCYANHSPASTERNRRRHDPKGEYLIV